MLSFEQALAHLQSAAMPLSDIEVVPLKAALGRVLASDQRAQVNMPPLDNSAMDGYAVRSQEVKPDTSLEVSQRIPAGTVGRPLQPGTCARIFTGAPVPAGADAVIMQELAEVTGAGICFREQPVSGQHIRKAGEDFSAGQVVLSAGCSLQAQHLALAAAAGLPSLPVFRRLKVAVFFTGDELVQPGQPLPPGAIYNSNRYALCGLLESLGCLVTDFGQVADTLEATRAALREAAAGHDLVLTSGGVSVGEEDHVKTALEAEGRVDLWKINIKPGKPLAFGYLRREGGETPFIGLPGNPVATFVTFVMLVKPFIRRRQGVRGAVLAPRRLPSAFAVPKPDRRLEFLRVRHDANGALALAGIQSSGALSSMADTDGLVAIPPETVVAAGDLLEFFSFAELLS